ncbi:hypothetical protein Pmani_024666 [Petrolisthes manimaculis]|uniref:Uncharacterized protein n=1 Tax=Petrolisthes manimaculis TaxID=1843537 RepID=A0AAE1P898_9EUCA|nr:hypothetical protein Pmani_024666 [Petrolisthes manimaculis]
MVNSEGVCVCAMVSSEGGCVVIGDMCDGSLNGNGGSGCVEGDKGDDAWIEVSDGDARMMEEEERWRRERRRRSEQGPSPIHAGVKCLYPLSIPPPLTSAFLTQGGGGEGGSGWSLLWWRKGVDGRCGGSEGGDSRGSGGGTESRRGWCWWEELNLECHTLMVFGQSW